MDVVSNGRRVAALEAAVGAASGVVVQVVAPAGFGKSRFVAALRDRVGSSAMLTLGTEHNDPVRFARDLAAALVPVGGVVLPVPGSGGFVGAVVAAAAGAGVRSLVFEDMHAVDDPVVVEAIAAVAWEARDVNVVISSRRVPPIGSARLKVLRRLLPVSRADLALSAVEVRGVLAELAGPELAGSVDGATIDRIDGWPAGAVLCGSALAAGGSSSMPWLIAESDIHQFVRDEVLAVLPVVLREVLLELSVLGVFDVDSATRATGRVDLGGHVDELVARQMFISEVPDRPGWLTFHELFATALVHEASARGSVGVDQLRGRHVEILLERGLVSLTIERLLCVTEPLVIAELFARKHPNGDTFSILLWMHGEPRNTARIIERVPLELIAHDAALLTTAFGCALAVHDFERCTDCRRALGRLGAFDGVEVNPALQTMNALLSTMIGDVATGVATYRGAAEAMAVPPWVGSFRAFATASGSMEAFFLAGLFDEAQQAAARAAEMARTGGFEVYEAARHGIEGLIAMYSGHVRRAADRLRLALASAARGYTFLDVVYIAALDMAMRLDRGDARGARRVGLRWLHDPDFPARCCSAAIVYRYLAIAEAQVGLGMEAQAHSQVAESIVASARGAGVFDLVPTLESLGIAPAPAARSSLRDVLLTDREQSILQLLRSRLTLRQIAEELNLSVNTVKTHTASIYRKLSVSSRSEVVTLLRPAS